MTLVISMHVPIKKIHSRQAVFEGGVRRAGQRRVRDGTESGAAGGQQADGGGDVPHVRPGHFLRGHGVGVGGQARYSTLITTINLRTKFFNLYKLHTY